MALSFVLALLVACAPTTPPPQGVASTPIQDLPVNVALRSAQTDPTPVPQAVIDAADAEYLLLTNIYERVAPSVVNVEVIATDVVEGFVDFGRGSGFVWDSQGHIVTNAHVVLNAREIRVTFENGYVTDARIVGVDTFSDLAVVQVDVASERLHPVQLGDFDRVRVGQRAIAIGNPFGLASSMTTGIVSGLGRQLRSAELIDITALRGFSNPSIIQVDTDINPGNSGGPLLNSNGEVIGVNTAIRTESGVFEGVGFAVPSSTIQRVVPELIANGQVDYAWLGISALPEEDGFSVIALAEALNLPVESGVLINRVTLGAPADIAGLQGGNHFVDVRGQNICAGGDIIIAVDDHFVKTMDELVAYMVINNKPGDIINLLIVRGGETFEVPVTLQARPDTDLVFSDCGP
jgi:2-alkenal reductase